MTQLLQITPVLDAFAECKRCELKHQKALKQTCYAYIPPKNFNGLMIVGEGPGRNEVVEGRPFVGRSGMLLRALCEAEGLNIDECYITNSSCCRPPVQQQGDKGQFFDRFPNAIHACLPRLEEEIARVRPRVILALGAAAMASLTGQEEKYTKRELFTCDHCGEDRKVDGIQCSKGDCKFVWEAPPQSTAPLTEEQLGRAFLARPQTCPQCEASWQRLKIRRVKCSKCGSRKMKDTEQTRFDWEYNLTEIAGAIIPGDKNGWDQMGVKYILATYHPSFLLQGTSEGSGEKKVMAGQFAAKTVQRHIRKAKHLLTQDVAWNFDFEVTSNEDADAAEHLHEYIYDGWQSDAGDLRAPGEDVPKDFFTCPYNFSVDIETEAWGAVYRCRECEKKSDIEVQAPPEAWGSPDRTALWVKLHAEILEHAWCKNCSKHTVQNPELGELDARELESVSNIKVIGFGSRKRGHALVVDTRHLGPKLKGALREVLTDARIRKTMQNGGYDNPVIRKLWGIKVEGYTDDTLSMHHALCPDESHNLSHLAFRYTYARIWKPPKHLKGHEAHKDFDELCLYNARDCVVTDDVREVMEGELARKGNLAKVYELDMKLQRQALDMQWNGMAINFNIAREVGATALQQRDDGLKEMRAIARNDEFNPNSPEQLRKILYEDLGYPVIVWTDGGKSGKKQPSTANDVLVRLPDTPFKRAMLTFRAGTSVLKAYFDVSRGVAIPGRGIRIWGDSRMHATWKPFGTRTGRFSSSPNFLNWPGWMRKMVVSPSGRRIVGADYDQLELRIIAALSNDAKLIHMCLTADDKRKLEPECDPHSYVALLSFGPLYTNLLLNDPKHSKIDLRCKCQTCTRKMYRDICKRVIYGLNYGAGAATVLEAIYNGGYNGPPLSIEMLERIKLAIYKAFPGIPRWRETTLKQATKDQAIFSPIMKRWRTFPLGDVPMTEIANFPIQSSAADLINIRNTIFYEQHMRRIDPTAMYLAQVHDAVYYEVDEDKAEAFEAQLTETLTWETALAPGGQVMMFSAGAKSAINWKDAA
jgi:uracil-DNA glycosylase family 4